MIFSQAQKQGILMLLGMVLAGYGLTFLFTEKPIPIVQQVSPLLLEIPKITPPQKIQSSGYYPKHKTSYKKQNKPYAKSKPTYQRKPKPPISIINLNSADTTELDAVPGIGAKTALRILKYKSLIGQFIAVEQLKMVYGISDENYTRMFPYFKVESVGEVEKKDLNAEKTYKIAWVIGKEKAETLTNKRKELGWLQNWEQLKELDFLTQQELTWLKTYFEIPPQG